MNQVADIFPYKSLTREDKAESWILIFAIYLIPFLQYTGLLPSVVTLLGTNVISLCLLALLWLGKIGRKPLFEDNKILGYSVVILFFYILFTLFHSSERYGAFEALVVFRRNFVGGLSLAFGVFYIQRFKPDCLPYVVHWVIVLCVIQSVLYIGHAMGLLHLYSGLETKMMEGGVSVNRTYAGIPKSSEIVGCLLLWSYIQRPQTKKLLLLGVLMVAVFMTYTRSTLASTLIILILFVSFLSFRKVLKVGTITKLVLFAVMALCLLYIIMPDSLDFWVSRFSTTQAELKDDMGTYDFRQKLVDYSIDEISYNDRMLTGMGYVHEAAKGEYSMVLGGDTLVAPVIYCEGMLGLILRILVFVPFTLMAFNRWLHSTDRKTVAVASLLLAAVIVNVISYMQTTYFTEYQTSLMLLLVVYNWGITKYNYIHFK